MATSKGHIARPNYRFLPGFPIDRGEYSLSDESSSFEFDESDIYNSARANSPEFRKTLLHSSRYPNNSSSSTTNNSPSGARPASVPVNVPDWSKILGDEYRHNRRKDNLDDGEEGDGDDVGERGCGRVPPHEFLARTRMASLSVHEGVGRTLKGRDLSRVRNAIWAKTGFQD